MPAISPAEVRRPRPCLRAGSSGKVVGVKSHAAVAPGDTYLQLAEEGDIRSQHRPLTHQVSLWLFFVVGVGLMVTVVCIVMYRTGSSDEMLWYYLGIFFGLPSAVCSCFACWAHALDDIR
jgi:hypothetical protein